MATGINSDKMNQSKINLLDCVEELNSLSNRLDNCYEDIQASLEGGCKSEVISKFGAIKREWPKVNQNINSYIGVLSKVESRYKRQDSELASKTNRDIDKIDDGLKF